MSFWVPIPQHRPGVCVCMWVSLNFRMIHGSCLEAFMHWDKWCVCKLRSVCVYHAQVKMLTHTNSSEVTQTSETHIRCHFFWLIFSLFFSSLSLFMVYFSHILFTAESSTEVWYHSQGNCFNLHASLVNARETVSNVLLFSAIVVSHSFCLVSSVSLLYLLY